MAFSLLAADVLCDGDESPSRRLCFALASKLTDTGDMEIDAPRNDPSPFLNVPWDVGQTHCMPKAIADAWACCFSKEVGGILIKQATCEIADPLPDDVIVPLMLVFKAKLNIDGMKYRVVFRGDLYDTKDPQNSWESARQLPVTESFHHALHYAQHYTLAI